MYVASALHVLCQEQEPLKIHSAAFFQPVNEGFLAVAPHSAHLTAAGEVFKLFRAHHGGRLLTTSVSQDNQDIDLCASLAEDGQSLFASVLNRNAEEERLVEIRVTGDRKIKSAKTLALVADDLTDPDATFAEKSIKTKVAAGLVTVRLPKYAVALLTIDLRD